MKKAFEDLKKQNNITFNDRDEEENVGTQSDDKNQCCWDYHCLNFPKKRCFLPKAVWLILFVGLFVAVVFSSVTVTSDFILSVNRVGRLLLCHRINFICILGDYLKSHQK